VAEGDLLNYGFIKASSVPGESGDLTIDWIGAHFLASTSSQCMIGGCAEDPAVIFKNQTQVSSLFGAGNPGANSNSVRATGLFPYVCSASKFTNHLTHVTSNSVITTLTLLKNGTPSGLSVSSMGEEGYFTEDMDTVCFAVGDFCTNQIAVTVSGAGSGDAEWAGAGLLLDASY
jgi:hypothetical protein